MFLWLFFWGGDYRAGLLGAIVVDERRGIDKGCVSGLAGLVPSVYVIHEMIHNRRRISVNIFGCGGRWARRAFAGSKFRERETYLSFMEWLRCFRCL